MSPKKPEKNISRELAALRPDSGALAILRPEALSRLRAEYESVTGNRGRRLAGMVTTAFVTAPLAPAVLGASTLLGVLTGAAVLIPSVGLVLSLLNTLQNETDKNRLLNLNDDLNDLIHRTMKERQKEVLNLSDRWLADRGLFAEEEKEDILPYLAAIPPSLLEGASDRLAVTVLQARMMLAYMKKPQERPKPPTLRFIGAGDDDLSDLRRLMMATVSPFEGIKTPEYVTLPEIKALRSPEKGMVTYMLGWPVLALRNVFKKAQAPKIDLAGFRMPSLPCADNVCDVLKEFESAHGPLDLPAFASSRRPRKALPLQPR